MDADTIAANRALQAQLYGRPLGEIVAELLGAFGLTQARLAEVLGLSAPMLSQLASGARVKVSNPAVLGRLQALVELAPRAHTLDADARAQALTDISEQTSTLTQTRPQPRSTIYGTLRGLATPDQLEAAAAAVEGTPLAAALREAARS